MLQATIQQSVINVFLFFYLFCYDKILERLVNNLFIVWGKYSWGPATLPDVKLHLPDVFLFLLNVYIYLNVCILYFDYTLMFTYLFFYYFSFNKTLGLLFTSTSLNKRTRLILARQIFHLDHHCSRQCHRCFLAYKIYS